MINIDLFPVVAGVAGIEGVGVGVDDDVLGLVIDEEEEEEDFDGVVVWLDPLEFVVKVNVDVDVDGH